MGKYLDFIKNHNLYFICGFLIFIVIFTPISYNSERYVRHDLSGVNTSSVELESLNFEAFKDDIVFVIKRDQGIFNQETLNWTDHIAFELQNHRTIQDYGVDATSVENIFSLVRNILPSYLTQIYFATAIVNVSSFIMIEGPKIFTSNFVNIYNQDLNITNAITQSENITLGELNTTLYSLSLGALLIDFSKSFVNKISDYVLSLPDEEWSDLNYTKVISSYSNPIWREDNTTDLSADLYSALLDLISPNLAWIEEDVLYFTSQFLYSDNSTESKEFISQVFAGGSDPTRPIKLAQQEFIPYLRGEYKPFGLPDQIRTLYLTTYTSYSENQQDPVAQIIRIRLRSNLTRGEISDVIMEMSDWAQMKSEENNLGIKLWFFSLVNVEDELSRTVSEDINIIDLVAIIAGIIFLFYVIRDIRYTLSSIGIAYFATQVSRGIIVLAMNRLQKLEAISFSIMSAVLLGAALNYMSFFVIRYLKELKDRDKEEALEIASKTALHSVVISAITVVLALSVYIFNDISLLSDFAIVTCSGIIIQLILLYHIIPAFFSYMSIELNDQPMVKINLGIKINKKRAKQILIITVIVSLLFVGILGILQKNHDFTEIIGNTSNSGEATEVLNEVFPDNYLSKVFILVQFNQSLGDVGNYNIEILNIINQLSQSLNQIPGVISLLSIAWPLTTYFNYSDQSIALVEREVAIEIGKQLSNSDQNQTYIFANVKGDWRTDQPFDTVKKIIDLVDKQSDSPYIDYTDVQGLIVTNFKANQRSQQLPYYLIVAAVLITLFLWWQLNSLSVPVRLELSILFSVIVALTVTSLIWLLFTGKALNQLVIGLSMVCLLGLGTDFDIFIYRAIQEELVSSKLPEAISIALEKTGTGIVISGLIMATTFFALILSEISLLKQFGITVAIAIIFDIFVVRSLIVPALLIFNYKEHE